MIALIGSMLRARLVQAMIIALLGTVTIGVAVAVPAFIAAGDNSVIAGELAHAPATQLDMHAATSFKLGGNTAQPDGTFARNVPADFALPGFDVTFSASTDVSVTGKTYAYPRLQFRQNQCDHIVIVVGRCAESTGEVMVNRDLARREGLSVGEWLTRRIIAELFASDLGLTPKPADETQPPVPLRGSEAGQP